MNPNREESLFALALEKPAAERSAFLKIVCGDDESLRQWIVTNVPDLAEIVSDEIDILFGEIAENSEAIDSV